MDDKTEILSIGLGGILATSGKSKRR